MTAESPSLARRYAPPCLAQAPLLLAIGLFPAAAHAMYEAVDLRKYTSPDGYVLSSAEAMNNGGEIVGQGHKKPYKDMDMKESARDGGRAVVLRGGQLHNLGVLSEWRGYMASGALGISDGGLIVGTASKNDPLRPAYWLPGQPAREAQAEIDPGYGYGTAKAVSPNGEWMALSVRQGGTGRAVVLRGGASERPEPLAAREGTKAFIHPARINDAGQLIGDSACSAGTCGYLWSAGKTQLLPGLIPLPAEMPAGLKNYTYTWPRAIDSAGNVAGCANRGGNLSSPVLWPAGAASPRALIDPLPPGGPGVKGGCAYGMNNRGDVVGYLSAEIGQHGFVWDARRGSRLLSPITVFEEGGWQGVEEAVAINDRGEILAYARRAPNPTADRVPVLLRPISASQFYLRKYKWHAAGAAGGLVLVLAGFMWWRRRAA